MRKIIMLVLMLSLIPLASAIEEGDLITQQQLDNFNLNNINWNFLQGDISSGVGYVSSGYLIKPYTMLFLERRGTNYIVYRGDYDVRINFDVVDACLEHYTLNQCKNAWETRVVNEIRNEIERTKRFVRQHQTNAIYNAVLEWLRNWTGNP